MKINGLRPWDYVVREAKRAIIEHFLRNAGGNVTHAARDLGLDRAYLSRLIHRHGVRRLR